MSIKHRQILNFAPTDLGHDLLAPRHELLGDGLVQRRAASLELRRDLPRLGLAPPPQLQLDADQSEVSTAARGTNHSAPGHLHRAAQLELPHDLALLLGASLLKLPRHPRPDLQWPIRCELLVT